MRMEFYSLQSACFQPTGYIDLETAEALLGLMNEENQ